MLQLLKKSTGVGYTIRVRTFYFAKATPQSLAYDTKERQHRRNEKKPLSGRLPA